MTSTRAALSRRIVLQNGLAGGVCTENFVRID